MSRLSKRLSASLTDFWILLKFQLASRGKDRRIAVETLGDMSLVVLPKVLNPVLFRSGEFLVENLSADMFSPHGKVLDLGTGTGLAAVKVAPWCRCVIAVDISPSAVKCARINALLNGRENKIEVRKGDLFEPVTGESFHRVIFNPPYFRGKPVTEFAYAFYSEDIGERFSTALRDHLVPGGLAYLVLSTRGDEALFLGPLRQRGFQTKCIAERKVFAERLRLYEVGTEVGTDNDAGETGIGQPW